MSACPQIAKTYRTKKADDISISYLLILMAGITLMTVYALHIGDPVFIQCLLRQPHISQR